MRGAFRGMFRFGCSSAYGPHSYSVDSPNQGGITGTDNVQFRSFLYSLISQASLPRVPEKKKRMATTIQEIFPGVCMGPEAVDLTIIGIALTIVTTAVIGGCFLLGWIIDMQERDARLQYAQQYAATHPAVAAEFGVPRQVSEMPIPFVPQTDQQFAVRATTYTAR